MAGDKTKTSEPRKVPITAWLRAVLGVRRAGPDGRELPADAYVFGDEAGGRIRHMQNAWRAACRRAGIEGLTFYDLRHEFTSSMLDAGVPIHKVRDWVGHKNIATNSIYANTTLSQLGDARFTFERRQTGTRLAQGPLEGGQPTVAEARIAE